MNNKTEEILAHYGVKGMRWGVRRSRKQLEAARGADAKDLKRTRNRSRYKGSPKRLTDEQLNQRLKRLETEKRYRDLNKRTVSKGEKLVAEVVTTVGKDTATKVGNGTAALLVKEGLNKQAKGLGDAILPKVKWNKE